jgi:toxin FitB
VAPRRYGVTGGSFVVLDTDVASLSIKRRLPASLLAKLVENDICITFVTLGELTKWMAMRRWGTKNRGIVGDWLDRALLLPYSREVATTWGELQADAVHRVRTPPQNDTWIAACCLV